MAFLGPLRLNSRGFSLTEVMVGGAILAGIAVAGARMFKDQRQGQARIDHEQQLNTFHQSLTKFIQNENNCNATFRDGFNQNSAWFAANPPTVLYPCSNCTNSTVNYDASPTTSRGTPFISNGAWIENVNGATGNQLGLWRLVNFSWRYSPGATGTATLRAHYEMNPAIPGSRATKLIRTFRDIPMSFRFTQAASAVNGLFKECISPKESSINNLQHDICNTMFSQIDSTGLIMTWDDSTQSCVPRGTVAQPVKRCDDPNMVVEGVGSDGVVRCRSMTRGVAPSTDYLNNAGCAPGATIRIEFDGTRFRTICN